MSDFADVSWRVLVILGDALWPAVRNMPWMTWNLILALIPMYLAARLFRRPEAVRPASVVWWMGVVLFVIFLPNALYVLTDLIHLYEDVPAASTRWRMAFVIVPQYILFCAIGFGAYVTSVIWLGRTFQARGWGPHRITALELSTHLACAIGVYLGRFVRFNSWDLIARPHVVADVVVDLTQSISPIGFIAVFFVSTSVLYWIGKHVLIAVVTYVRSGGMRQSHRLVGQYM
jgi:uncharacterized membrane protein